jgi:hypothetical protein
MPVDKIEARSNLNIVARERGKIVAKRTGHNIWLDLGGEYLAHLIAYSAFGPDTTYRDDRVRYMGLGIGGTRQLALASANSPPHSVSYPGSNVQTDTNPALSGLERPVRITGGSGVYPGVGTDVWLGQIQAPPVFPTAKSVTFRRLFVLNEISYAPFITVPLSEIMLFTSASDIHAFNNPGVAYDTFDTVSKTSAFDLEVDWTIRF